MKPDDLVYNELLDAHHALQRDFLALAERHSRALLEAHQRGRDEKEREIADLLKDPAAVRVNYLRGGIACQPLLDEAHQRGRRKGMEEAAAVAVDNKQPGYTEFVDGYNTACEDISDTIRAKLGEVQK